MGKHLVIVGGGHAHMLLLENIASIVAKGHRVTVVGPSDYHFYSGMGPGMLGGTYTPEDIRFATADVVRNQGGGFVRDRVVAVDPERRSVVTEGGETLAYDVISFNAGSYVPMHSVAGDGDNIYAVKPIEKLMEAGEKLAHLFRERRVRIAIVGGGPSSAEVAGNVWQLAKKVNRHMPGIQVFAGRKFMSRFPQSIRKRIISILEGRGVEIVEKGYAQRVETGSITLDSGDSFTTDFIFMALGVKPSSLFENSGLPLGPDKGILVNRYLQSTKYPEVFGGGDCIYFQDKPLDKVGVYAVRQNPILVHNIMAALGGDDPMKAFEPGPDYLLIFNLGGGQGVLKKKGVVFGGKIAFMIKDYIDRKFMHRFQAIEKTSEKG